VVVWNILARASTVSWILHTQGEPERKKIQWDRIQLRTRYVEDVSAYDTRSILSLAGLVTLSR
jgi:hypothetical protein